MSRPTEGDPVDEQVAAACSEARRVVDLCDLLGFEFRGGRHLVGLLEGSLKSGVALSTLIEDPSQRPYVWDLEEEE